MPILDVYTRLDRISSIQYSLESIVEEAKDTGLDIEADVKILLDYVELKKKDAEEEAAQDSDALAWEMEREYWGSVRCQG